MTSVIGLFPAGLNETNYSIGENYSAVSVNDMYAYIAREAQLCKTSKEWEKFLKTIPDSKPNIEKADNVLFNTDNWGSPIEGNIYITKKSNDGIYGLKIGSSNSQNYTAQILIWKSVSPNDWTGGVDNISGINIETAWPLAKEYKDRFHEKYYFEIFNPNPKIDEAGWNKMQDDLDDWLYDLKVELDENEDNNGHGNDINNIDISNPGHIK
jgi:hypothetical protein